MDQYRDMELRAVVPAIVIMWFVPNADQLQRFIMPILSGLVWMIIKWLIRIATKKYNKYKNKES